MKQILIMPVLVHASVFAQSGWIWQNSVSPTTTIHSALPKASRAVLKLYDILGREVLALVEGDFAAGRYNGMWQGQDRYGNSIASGIYFLRIEAKSLTSQRGLVSMKKMLLVK